VAAPVWWRHPAAHEPRRGPITEADERHLRRAIELAAEARAAGDMPFGSLLVGPGGEVLAEDRNTVLTERDISAHPELKLARWAARRLEPDTARGTTLYTSCQPCPMCAGAIARSGLGRVVFALSAEQLQGLRPDGAAGPDAAQIAYEGPALFDEARVPIEGHYS
jgi:tRNA(Arg) A34 adenosine deaminase TadA